MVEAGRRLDAFVASERKVYDDWSINVVARAHQDDLEGSVTLDGLDALRQSAHITEPASMQVSELLHHCRTALDYCIHAVAWIDSGRANPKTQFPMCATPAKWGEALRGQWLRGLSSQHLGWVKDVQPYSSVEWTKSLSLLSNQDKHRVNVMVSTRVTLGLDLNRLQPDPLGDPEYTGFVETDRQHDLVLVDVAHEGAGYQLEATPTLTQIVTGAAELINRFLPLQGLDQMTITSKA